LIDMPTPPHALPQLSRRLRAALALSLIATLGLILLGPSRAGASTRQIAIIQDQNQLAVNPAGTLQEMQALGATTVRVLIDWDAIAPDIQSTHRPRFRATDPAAYPTANWDFYDEIVRLARVDGMTVDLTLTGGAPRWAEGSGIPSNYIISHNGAARYYAWKPNSTEFGQFVEAVGRRYDGRYTPKGESSALPRVHFWTIWNEPNFGINLGPQATDISRISYAPGMYRNLVRTGYRGLRITGHSHDTILIGEFAAHGSSLSDGRHGPKDPQGLPGYGAQTQPLPFIRTLYCLSPAGAQLTGTAARLAGCATTASGRHLFRVDNPGLFTVTGVGDHPYANNATPASDGADASPEWSTLPNLGRLEATLDQATHAWGSDRHYPIYNDEYGYITDPPQRDQASSVPVGTAARYINWAEYLSWREPRVASYDQYLIQDGPPNAADDNNGGFATGLYTSQGRAKPSLNAYRMPLWVPSPELTRAGRDTVWGEARPAYWVAKVTGKTQSVQIQFRAHDRGSFETIKTVRSDTYFEVRPTFSQSGEVRLRFTYPTLMRDATLQPSAAGRSIISRSQQITVG
jgi:hypothetical protein